MKTIFKITLLILYISSCGPKKTTEKVESPDKSSESEINKFKSIQIENESDNSLKSNSGNNYTGDCNLEDGTYSASVEYNNSETGYYANYTLDVEVQDCQVIQINFDNGGHLDSDHITIASIDEDGNAFIEGEDGKTYEVHIDN